MLNILHLFKSKLPIVLLFFIVVKGTLFAITYWPVNFGWLTMNKGLAFGNRMQTSYAQEKLAEFSTPEDLTRLDNLIDAKLDESNLLINGGYEYYQQGWEIIGTTGSVPVISSEYFYMGEHSLEIIFLGKDVNFYQVFQKVAVETNQCYQLLAQIKSEKLTDGVGIEIWDGDEGYEFWYGGQTQLVIGTTLWTPISLMFCTPNNVDSIQVRLRRYGGYGKPVSGTVWFDELKLIPLMDQ